MSFAQRLQSSAAQVDARLHDLLRECAAPIAGDLPCVGPWPERLAAAITHGVLAGGKRLRPFLMIECAALFGVERRSALDAAAALECVHCYSLVHDDLPAMDNDELRRGAPTVWKAFDDWTAILVGDSLLTLAFEILARPSTHPDPAVRAELVATLARASGAAGMAGGQALDLDASRRGVPADPDVAHVARLQSMKTGALIVAACDMGAVLGRASPEQRMVLRRYGAAVGSAFQIADDLLDAEGDTTTTGKAVAKDAAAGKATLVGLLGPEASRARLAELEAEALDALSVIDGTLAAEGDLADAARFMRQRRS